MGTGLKECRKCCELKNLDEFGTDKKAKDGKKRFCKSCISILNKNNYSKKREKKISQILEWQEENADKVREYKRNYARKQRKQD